MGGLRLDGGVGWLTEHCLFQVAPNSCERFAALAPKQVGGLAASHQVRFEPVDPAERVIQRRHHPAGAACRRIQQSFVIALQPEKGLRVTGNHIDQAAPLVGGQCIARCGLFHQLQCRFQLGGVLLKALAVESVALGEVFAQDACCPLAEAGGSIGVDTVAH